MLAFFKENWATVLISLLVLAVAILAIWVLVKDRRKGSCGSCRGCPYAGKCQKNKNGHK